MIAPLQFSTAPQAPTLRTCSADQCSACSLHGVCLPTALSDEEMQRLDNIIGRRRRVPRGASLFRTDEAFTKLYAIRVGHFKTCQLNASGEEQVTGFQMPGELLGLSAIGTQRHSCTAVALEDSEVCEIPFAQFESLLQEMPTLLRTFHALMSREITREQSAMLLLGSMRAEQRLAVFLVNMGARYAARGYSPYNFQLRMLRDDIGNYLGLTIESVSRLLTRFRKEGMLRVSNREIEILDPDRLKALAAGTTQN